MIALYISSLALYESISVNMMISAGYYMDKSSVYNIEVLCPKSSEFPVCPLGVDGAAVPMQLSPVKKRIKENTPPSSKGGLPGISVSDIPSVSLHNRSF